MKKYVSILILFIIIFMSTFVLAEDLNGKVAVNITMPQQVKEGTTTVTAKISLGNFEGVEENNVLGFQTTLEYNKDIFASITVTGLNGWDVSYEDNTKQLIGLTKTSKANVEIAQIVFTFKEGVKAGASDNILFNSFVLTDDNTLNQTMNYSKAITVIEEKIPQETANNTARNNTITNDNIVVGNDNNTTNDATIKKISNLPATGIRNIIITIIVIILLVGAGFMIRSASIKLK